LGTPVKRHTSPTRVVYSNIQGDIYTISSYLQKMCSCLRLPKDKSKAGGVGTCHVFAHWMRPLCNFFTDGKPWRMSRPGNGRCVREICAAAGTPDVNLMQRAFYNGHYKYHGGKVQHVLQADGIAYSYTCPIRNHDALVLRNSSMLLMLTTVYINGDLIGQH
jgi:hypothetical protein